MNKLDFLRLQYDTEYRAVCLLNGECVIEKTKSTEKDGRVNVTYLFPHKVTTRHFSFFMVKGEK